jgi:hypothetical protein
MDDAVEKLREPRMFADQTMEVPLRMLDLVDHYHATAGALWTSAADCSATCKFSSM